MRVQFHGSTKYIKYSFVAWQEAMAIFSKCCEQSVPIDVRFLPNSQVHTRRASSPAASGRPSDRKNKLTIKGASDFGEQWYRNRHQPVVYLDSWRVRSGDRRHQRLHAQGYGGTEYGCAGG
jgi:hypothetical protein